MGTTTPRPRPPLGRCWGVSLLVLAASLPLVPPVASEDARLRVVVGDRTLAVPRAESPRTVREALASAGVALDPDDHVEPPLDAPVREGLLIRVRRVVLVRETEERPIPFRTVVRPATGRRRPYHPTVLKEGRDGVKRIVYRVRKVDGREVERSAEREELVREPVEQVVVARRPAALGSRGAYTGKRTLTLLATAYDPGPGSCGRWADGKTCNGKRAGYGIIAVDPKVIPLGTKLFVPGYGYGIAADVGGAIRGNRLDLGYNSRSGALEWGKRWVRVTVLD